MDSASWLSPEAHDANNLLRAARIIPLSSICPSQSHACMRYRALHQVTLEILVWRWKLCDWWSTLCHSNFFSIDPLRAEKTNYFEAARNNDARRPTQPHVVFANQISSLHLLSIWARRCHNAYNTSCAHQVTCVCCAQAPAHASDILVLCHHSPWSTASYGHESHDIMRQYCINM